MTGIDTTGDVIAWPTTGAHARHDNRATRPSIDRLTAWAHGLLVAARDRLGLHTDARHRDDHRPPLERHEQHIDISGEVVQIRDGVAVSLDDQDVTVAGYSPLTATERMEQAPHHWGAADHYLHAGVGEETAVLIRPEVTPS